MAEHPSGECPMTMVYESLDEIDALSVEDVLGAADIPCRVDREISSIFGQGTGVIRIFVEPAYVDRAIEVISDLRAQIDSRALETDGEGDGVAMAMGDDVLRAGTVDAGAPPRTTAGDQSAPLRVQRGGDGRARGGRWGLVPLAVVSVLVCVLGYARRNKLIELPSEILPVLDFMLYAILAACLVFYAIMIRRERSRP